MDAVPVYDARCERFCMSERELLILAMRGDEASYIALFKKHQKTIERIARNTTRNLPGAEDAARDVVQETFIRGYRKILSYRGDGPFAGWLAVIAKNIARDAIRKHKRRKEVVVKVKGEDGTKEADVKVGLTPQEQQTEEAAEEAEAMKQELLEKARPIIESLSPKEREIWDMLIEEPRPTVREMVRRTGLTPGQIRGRIAAVKKKVRRKAQFFVEK